MKYDSLTFGYDQARDALITKQILSGDIKIQGPPSSTPGLFHGVFYYYLLAPAYLLGNGSPIIAAYWLAFLNSLTVVLVFLIGYRATKKPLVGLLASLFFAVSFESTQYATWMSNPTIGVWTVPLMYLGLWLWTREECKLAPIIAAIGLGLSVQAEIFLIYHVIPLVIWLIISKKKILKKQLLTFFGVLILTFSTLILCEIKFGFNSLSAISSLASTSGGNLAYAKSIGDYLLLYLNQIGRVFAFNTYPGNIGYGGMATIVLGIVSLVRYKKDPFPAFLATWLFAHLSVVSVGGTYTPFLMVGIGPAVSLILAYYIHKLFTNKKALVGVFVALVIFYGNLSYILKENASGSTLFAIQKDMLLSKQKNAIDYTYQKADGQEFSINTLTSPLWINIVWSYLYKWYGYPKYGYLPSFHGRDQIRQLDQLEKSDDPKEISFLILEPMGGIPPKYLPLTIGEEDSKSEIVEEKSFGEIIVQLRH